MDEKSLYKMSWGGRGQDEAEFERIVTEEFLPRRREQVNLHQESAGQPPVAIH